MKISVVSIGNELLIDRLNTNLLILSSYFSQYGLNIDFSMNVKDDLESIKIALEHSFDFSDIIITTGGLGPTVDDLTRNAVSFAISKKLIFSEKIFESIILKLKKLNRKIDSFIEGNIKNMSYIFENGKVIDNFYGTACGHVIDFQWQKKSKLIILLPGPPFEIKPMLSLLDPYFEKARNDFQILEFQFFSLTESEVDLKVREILKDFADVETAILVDCGVVYLKFTIIKNEFIYSQLKSKIDENFNDYIISYDKKNIFEIVLDLLVKYSRTISFAESCTGGLLAKMFTDIKGSSKVFIGGIVSYSNDVKMTELGVSEEVLNAKGSVSEEVCYQMALGANRKFNTYYSISITGAAGPDGNKVGLVYIGININGKVKVYENNFNGDRETIRKRAAYFAISKIIFDLKGILWEE